MNKLDVSAIGQGPPQEVMTQNEDPFFSKHLIESSLRKTIQPLFKNNDIIHSQILEGSRRKHKLFERLNGTSCHDFMNNKSAKIEFKIPPIKEYYIEDQSVESHPKVPPMYRLNSLIGKEFQDKEKVEQENLQTSVPNLNNSTKIEKKDKTLILNWKSVTILIVILGVTGLLFNLITE